MRGYKPRGLTDAPQGRFSRKIRSRNGMALKTTRTLCLVFCLRTELWLLRTLGKYQLRIKNPTNIHLMSQRKDDLQLSKKSVMNVLVLVILLVAQYQPTSLTSTRQLLVTVQQTM